MPRCVAALLSSLVVLAAGGAAASAAERVSTVAVPISSPLSLRVLEGLGLDVTEASTPQRAVVVLHGAADRRTLRGAGYRGRVLVRDMEAAERRAQARARMRARAAADGTLPSGRTGMSAYRFLGDYDQDLQTLAQSHPGLVRRFELPERSVQGRPIWGVEIASNVNRTDDGRPVFLVFGIHHAREWPSGEVAIEFAIDLAKRYGSDPRVTALLDRVRVIVVPVTNPDGFVVSRGTPGEPGADDVRRTNCAVTYLDQPSDPCVDREGVDLNRNYAAGWGGPGSGPSASLETYRGPAPWSEPETRGVHELSQRRQVTAVVSIHNIGALVLRPPGFYDYGDDAPDEPRLKELGDRMAMAADYESQHGYELYEVNGSTEDWNYIEQGAYGYTMELGPGASALFHGPYQSHVVDQYLGGGSGGPAGRGVREALIEAAEEAGSTADHALITGSGTPGNTLRLHRSFTTSTVAICDPDCSTRKPAIQLDDFVDTTMTVPADGTFTWHVGPSTRPWVRAAGGTEAWTLTCENPAGAVVGRVDLVVGRGQTASVDPCTDKPAPVITQTPSTDGPGRGGSRDGSGNGTRRLRVVVGKARMRAARPGVARSLVAGVSVSGGVVRQVRAVVRDRRGLTVASRRYARMAGRMTVRVPVARGIPAAGLRLSLTGVGADGTVIRAFSARL